jgi:hypothetical protein
MVVHALGAFFVLHFSCLPRPPILPLTTTTAGAVVAFGRKGIHHSGKKAILLKPAQVPQSSGSLSRPWHC